MKKHLPLIIAVATVAVNVRLLLWFIPMTQGVLALQTSPIIRLPVARREPPIDDSGSLRLRLNADGATYAEEKQLSDASLDQLIVANLQNRVIVEATPDVSHERVKVLFRRLQAAGVRPVVFKVDGP